MSQAAKKDTPEQAEYRAYCRKWIEENRPEEPDFRLPLQAIEVMDEGVKEYLQTWQKKAYDGGLIGVDYPTEYGGGGKSGMQTIANQELAAGDVPYFINVIGLGMCAPTIFHHASEELKRRFIPQILSGEMIWCQGFSEPGAGSDLASCNTSVVKKGDKWIVNGHKVWTSLAHYAGWMIALVRTSNHDKYKGLSFFVLPVQDTKGVTIRPLIKITGETGFNEVIFEDLEVPDSYRLDDVGKGWTVAMTTLTHERGAGTLVGPNTGMSARGATRTQRLLELAKKCRRNGKPAIDDPFIRDRIALVAVWEEGLAQNQRRAKVPGLTDDPMRIPLQGKVSFTELAQLAATVALEIEGQASSLYIADPMAPDSGTWPLTFLNSYGNTIAAGTSEVQRNILGERVRGMAKSK